MKEELEKLCTAFIANRDTVQKAFRWDDSNMAAVCANIFCACGKTADEERLKECRKIVEAQTGHFSKFRKKTRSILCCMLALEDHPEERMERALASYGMLKKEFRDTEFLALAALLLTEPGEDTLIAEKVTRGKEIFRRMDREHPFLTDNLDSVFAVTLAFSEKSDDELIQDLEACYKALKAEFSSSGDVQTAAQILAMSADAPETKAQRVIDLYNALTEAEVKYGHAKELAPLAALSLADATPAALAEEIREAYEFLGNQKGYGDKDKEQRAMHAVMIVSDRYPVTGRVNSSVMATTLDVLIAKQRSMYLSLAYNVVQAAAKFLLESKEQPEAAETAETAESAEPAENGSGEEAAVQEPQEKQEK